MLYTSVENKRIKEIKKLNQKKYRDTENEFLIEGRHLVLEAYKKGLLKTVILEQDEIFPLAVETMYVTSDIINYLADTETPQNVMGICSKMEENKDIGDHILILDEIQDPGNLGTIIRSAVAFNIDTIVLGDKTVDLYNPKVVRASQGMMFHINIVKKNLNTFIPELKKQQYKILGTKVTRGKSLKTLEKNNKFAIIMGNEGNGVKEEILDMCDDYIYIEMNAVCESLNVAVATSIILYELDK